MELKYEKSKVNETYPEATMIEAMRIWSLPKNKQGMLYECCENGEYFAQIKKDGFWYEFNKTKNHSYLFSRTESTVTGLLSEKSGNVPHIVKALSVLPADTIIIGEIYVPGGTSKDTTRIMGCLPKLATERQQKEGNIHFYMHDIIYFNGVSLLNKTAVDRYAILKKVIEIFNLLQYDFLELSVAFEENIIYELKKALENGEEGLVLKKKDSLYCPGKKPAWSSIKCKKVDYADVVCMGFEDATEKYSGSELEGWSFWMDLNGNKYNSHEEAKKQELAIIPITKPYYYGWKTSIIIGAYNSNGILEKIGTVSSGLTDELKQSILENEKKYLNKVLMVECMEKDKDAKTMRHPIFKGFREDKNSIECTIEDIFNS